jgi:hypothetical protein
MPIIKQIGDIKQTEPLLSWARNNYTIFDLDLTDVDIEKAYLETVKFIRWYNTIIL